MKGFVHIYTGEGKGKTTAALGLALRAAGAGMRVLVIQFLKGRTCSEHRGLERFPEAIAVEQYGGNSICTRQTDMEREHGIPVRKGLERARAAVSGREFGMIILDEAVTAMTLGLLTEDDLLGLMERRDGSLELVLTGRGATRRLIDAADLVTEMKCVKHYFDRGVPAREGIEK